MGEFQRVHHLWVGTGWDSFVGVNSKEASTNRSKKGRSELRLPRLEQGLAERLVAEAREAGGVAALTGPDGLLAGLVAQRVMI